ncbi:MAG: hypothetical protein Q8O14_02150 [bacterium]|nr:hypothetical protein [bacterium]
MARYIEFDSPPTWLALMESVLHRFQGEIFERDYVSKWSAVERETSLAAYLRQCLRNSLKIIPDEQGTQERWKTANRRIREILAQPTYQTIEEARDPWKAPSAWSLPVAKYNADLESLARQLDNGLLPELDVERARLNGFIDTTFEFTLQAHQCQQFMTVLDYQGAFMHMPSSLDSTWLHSGSEDGSSQPQPGDRLIGQQPTLDESGEAGDGVRNARRDAGASAEGAGEHEELDRVVVHFLRRMRTEHRRLLLRVVPELENQLLGEDQKIALTTIMKSVAPEFGVSWRALDEQWRRHIQPALNDLCRVLSMQDDQRKMYESLLACARRQPIDVPRHTSLD